MLLLQSDFLTFSQETGLTPILISLIYSSEDTMHKSIFELKIGIRYLQPRVWRRIEVPSDMTLAAFHKVLQAVFEWHNMHLYEFRVGEQFFAEKTETEVGVEDVGQHRLDQVLTSVGDIMLYTYDLGQRWEHDILLESIKEVDPVVGYPRCIGGKSAAPTENGNALTSSIFSVGEVNSTLHTIFA
mmetsp:Transcript_5847/g.9634  ORF Transcript_5847/g.9634 Transcript_5847/m.9634 type:complete len:185 (-) Transcript_5847:539-1093(-)